MYNISAYQIADNIDLDTFHLMYDAEIVYLNPNGIFYRSDPEHYIYIFEYGVVCFFNYNETPINDFIKLVFDYCDFFFDEELSKKYQIEIVPSESDFGFNRAVIPQLEAESLRLIMQNIAQSVALDNYFQKVRILLDRTNIHVDELKNRGKLGISDKVLKPFIGKTLKLRNHITNSLQVYDLIPPYYQKTTLNTIDARMNKALNVRKRVKNIQQELSILNEHLAYFTHVMQFNAYVKQDLVWIILLGIFAAEIIIEKVVHIYHLCIEF
jgi:required for meiotic nuclear division protein 1